MSNKTKHTKGPWEAVGATVQAECRYICTAGSIHPGRTDEDLANAQLIAAAPDLLEGLMQAAHVLECHEQYPAGTLRAVAENARLAIKKATDAA